MKEKILKGLNHLRDHFPNRYWLVIAAIEASSGASAEESALKGKSKGDYKRIIREGRMLTSSTCDPGILCITEQAIEYIRGNMEEWRG